MSVFSNNLDHLILKLHSCQTALLQLTDQRFSHFLCNFRLAMVFAGVCVEEMGLCFTIMSVCSLGYRNNFKSYVTITQLNLSNSLFIGPNFSILNQACPGQNLQNEVRPTDCAS